MVKTSKSIIFILITVLIFIGMSYFGLKLYVEKVERIEREKAARANILEGVQLEPIVVEVDYSKKIADGSPLVFGGAQSPQSEEAWNKVAESGVTFLRTDFFLEYSIPNSTVEDYKKNLNNIQDPNNWNTNYINSRKEIFRNAKNRNMKTLGIVSYSPRWLTYSGTQHGIPKDWEVYSDIVKKMYMLHREYIDYVEIWNEPTHDYFFDLEKSPYTKEEAYKLIYMHASKAIREVDKQMQDGKTIKIGAQVSHDPFELEILDELLKDDKLVQNVDFVSYHNYVTDEPSWGKVKDILTKNHLGNTPIMLTEWNYDSKEKENSPQKTEIEALTFTATKLINFLEMGLLGANYYSLFPLDKTATNLGHGYLSYYKNTSTGIELLPQSRTWNMLSNSMGLGKGESQIFETVNDNTFASIGFINDKSQKGTVIVNSTNYSQLMEFRLKNAGIQNRAKIEIFNSSEEYDGRKPIESRIVFLDDEQLIFKYLVPKNSLIGFTFAEEKEWYDIFDTIIKSNQPKKTISPV